MSPRPKVGLEFTKILEAAGELADDYGMQEVSLANLAKKLNIRPPSLYNHFDGLQGLRKELAIFGIDFLYAELAQSAIGVARDEAVIALSKAYINFARKHPGIYEATLMAPDPEDMDVQLAGEKVVNLTVRILQAFKLEGDKAIHAVRGLRSILHGFSSLEQKHGFNMELDLDESLVMTVRAFLIGITG
ncbi:TetR/AcrR family transcriptional regulator [Neobacillus ginsengisoli]|uniref:AcrR family transcriptional regulator n=1 Tax=Neobacillus ginsengisoli TaxID=904295 RepID=A0ABT9XYM2_9BACI|nr:TetR/AcrR family transcriptional regulator [Neobacillus ginsengisoli]MDQ0200473.1 AcrR family transcriptional regulator [Neobacillus ginsengisoli]